MLTAEKHAVDQIRSRVGLKKKAVPRHIKRVLEKGTRLCDHHDVRMRAWADWARNHYRADLFYFFGNFIYAFDRKGTELELVTVLYPPNDGAWEN